MPIGSENFGTGSETGRIALRFSTRKPLYLKIPSNDRLIVTARTRAAYPYQLPEKLSTSRLHSHTRNPDASSRKTQTGSPQA